MYFLSVWAICVNITVISRTAIFSHASLIIWNVLVYIYMNAKVWLHCTDAAYTRSFHFSLTGNTTDYSCRSRIAKTDFLPHVSIILSWCPKGSSDICPAAEFSMLTFFFVVLLGSVHQTCLALMAAVYLFGQAHSWYLEMWTLINGMDAFAWGPYLHDGYRKYEANFFSFLSNNNLPVCRTTLIFFFFWLLFW